MEASVGACLGALGPARGDWPSSVEGLCWCREVMTGTSSERIRPCPSSVPPLQLSLQTTDRSLFQGF